MDINVCCMQCIQTVRDYSLRKLDIRFEPECAQLPVNTSCLLLSKALTELLRNAARFAPDGRITLAYTLISHKKRIAFTVTDGAPASLPQKPGASSTVSSNSTRSRRAWDWAWPSAG